ncbi:hypothetical protein JI721_05110 [Alicyclobacillus cycloheptanicus]|uniref:Uncharacterized protein n=1 Tax=Alicyclobacillus cycloheptanicus TaxID=1457 RepID=A0ABT9XHX9_9BACL|nr:YfmQ family protein [Alicyclobacillus cycloheptanicus]MDQ0189900.1 hypothetical protein [Alicyclobacillus cycloheptanicus]WDM02196.1 hypothetical protein JI721_05110 [Alicyclobacillus cycloheptanicus]
MTAMLHSIWLQVVIALVTLLISVILMTPTERGARRLITRFELHYALDADTSTVSVGGRPVERAEKQQIIEDYNQAIFIQRYDYPPQPQVTPIVVHTKQGNADVTLSLYVYADHVDVVKQRNKKSAAFRLWYSDQRGYNYRNA